MNKNEKILKWYHNEAQKDDIELKQHKENLINSIKKIDKSDIFEESKKEKITLWKRIKKVLMGI